MGGKLAIQGELTEQFTDRRQGECDWIRPILDKNGRLCRIYSLAVGLAALKTADLEVSLQNVAPVEHHAATVTLKGPKIVIER